MWVRLMERQARGWTVAVATGVALRVALNSSSLFDGSGWDRRATGYVTSWLPAIFYLAAIWVVVRAHTAIARGQEAAVALARLIERLGLCLLLGGLVQVFGGLWLDRILLGGPGPWARFDVAAITLGCVGLLLLALARPLREAAAARAELAEIL